MKVCSRPGCPTVVETSGRCPDCRAQVARTRRATDPMQRAYTSPRHRRFRRLVLKRDPQCVLCGAVASVADHYPVSRRDLVAQGLDPDDPARGRGLCASCHGRETATNPDQAGGWNAR